MARVELNSELGAKITNLRTAQGLSKAQFSEKLRISSPQLLRWEKAKENPSNEKLVALGNMAHELISKKDNSQLSEERAKAISEMRKYPDSYWFWKRAGINLVGLLESLSERVIKGDPSAGEKTVLVPHLNTAGLLQFVKRGAVNPTAFAVGSIPFPAPFVPSPASTICVQATDRVAGSPLFAGDLSLIRLALPKRGEANAEDVPDLTFENLIGCSVAAFYENSPVVRELSPEAARRRPRGRLLTEADRRIDRLNRLHNPEIYAADDRKNDDLFEKIVATVESGESGVLFGSLHVQSHENWDGDFNRLKGDYPWRLVLDCGDTWNGLTGWSTEEFPWDGTLRHRLNPGVHILGTVVGWLRAAGEVAKV